MGRKKHLVQLTEFRKAVEQDISIDKLKNDVKNHLDKKFSLWYKILLKDVDLKEKLEKLNKQYLTNY